MNDTIIALVINLRIYLLTLNVAILQNDITYKHRPIVYNTAISYYCSYPVKRGLLIALWPCQVFYNNKRSPAAFDNSSNTK